MAAAGFVERRPVSSNFEGLPRRFLWGRRPSREVHGLAAIARERGVIAVDSEQRTSNPRAFAAGAGLFDVESLRVHEHAVAAIIRAPSQLIERASSVDLRIATSNATSASSCRCPRLAAAIGFVGTNPSYHLGVHRRPD